MFNNKSFCIYLSDVKYHLQKVEKGGSRGNKGKLAKKRKLADDRDQPTGSKEDAATEGEPKSEQKHEKETDDDAFSFSSQAETSG